MPRGLKTCPKCQAAFGPRKKVCDCGFVFIKDAAKAPKQERGSIVPPPPGGSPSLNPSAVPPPPPSTAVSPQVDEARAQARAAQGISPTAPVDFEIVTIKALDQFISDLRAAKKDSLASGGEFSVFAQCRHGRCSVKVWLPIKPKKDQG